jgi:Domain of unknown function (DUF4136)
MKNILKFAAPVALLSLGACATPFQAKVSRFQQLPVPQGQSFAVVADSAAMNDSLEFQTYARMVAAKLGAVGYAPASGPAAANLIVRMDYGVDKGRERLRSAPSFGYARYGLGYGGYGYGPWGRPYYGYGRRAFAFGFYDPFLFDDYNEVESYTVYNSQLNLRIERKNGERVFEGKAQAMSTDNDLTTLVPNLVEAMFTNFPGNSGETVKITVAPPGKRR